MQVKIMPTSQLVNLLYHLRRMDTLLHGNFEFEQYWPPLSCVQAKRTGVPLLVGESVGWLTRLALVRLALTRLL